MHRTSNFLMSVGLNPSWSVLVGRYLCSREPLARYYHIVKPGTVSPIRPVPRCISAPRYDISPSQTIDLKSGNSLEKLRESCKLARKVLDLIGQKIKPGLTTDELDKFAHETIISNNAYPSPLLYQEFPKSICTSVNNVACHGIPDDRPLQDGDIISVDVTVYYNGYHGDCAETYEVGNVDDQGKTLIKAAKACRDAAISACGPGKPLKVIGQTVSSVAKSFKFGIMPLFCGHGIGKYFHGMPDIYHFENNFEGVMEEGMTFTIEPVICEGNPEVAILEDGWTAVSLDNSRAAQFEHTIVITEYGSEILTK